MLRKTIIASLAVAFVSSASATVASARGGVHGRGYENQNNFYYPYASSASYRGNGDCYVVRRIVHVTHGWRLRPN
jgi:hypothetical protein